MKTLIIAILLWFMPAYGLLAASTDTIHLAESKVVEIHMTGPADAEEKAIKKHRNHNVEVVPLPGYGVCSGSFVDEFGDILTAKHCVTGFDAFQVFTSDGKQYAAELVAASAKHDVALLHIDRLGTPFFRLGKKIERGQSIFVLGSPLGLTNTLSVGTVAKLNGDQLLLDCGVLPGNSGGPVFDAAGDLVGVISAGYIVMLGTTHLNLAEGLDVVWFFLYEVSRKR